MQRVLPLRQTSQETAKENVYHVLVKCPNLSKNIGRDAFEYKTPSEADINNGNK